MKRDGSLSPHPFTPPVRRLLASQLLTGIVIMPVAAFFPVYLRDLGYSALIISWIVTLQSSTCLFSTLAAGALSYTLGSKRTPIAGQAADLNDKIVFGFGRLRGLLQQNFPWSLINRGFHSSCASCFQSFLRNVESWDIR